MAFLMLMRRMDRGGLTAHGFRATFKTWASERTSVQNEIVEASLAHRSAARSRPPIGAAICSTSGAG
jgi:integrase